MTNVEIWNDIPNYEGLYQVSDLGNVRKSSITINKIYKILGFFTDEYQAHLAYQKALSEIT